VGPVAAVGAIEFPQLEQHLPIHIIPSPRGRSQCDIAMRPLCVHPPMRETPGLSHRIRKNVRQSDVEREAWLRKAKGARQMW
jgi:hypothetical protein